MATNMHAVGEDTTNPRKRKLGRKKGSNVKKRLRAPNETMPKIGNSRKFKKLYQKRAKQYNSDDEESGPEVPELTSTYLGLKEESISGDEGPDDLDVQEEKDGSGDDVDEVHEGGKFNEGCRAFRMAFMKIMKTKVTNDPLGPVLSGHKKLIAERLAEEESERKVKTEAKKEKLLVKERGHVKPANYLDAKEKFLISVATKGAVKLFNAVSKAQNAQKGMNPSKSKDAKAMVKQKKKAFLSEIRKPLGENPNQASSLNFLETSKASDPVKMEQHSWAPLRDSYMLTDMKLKDWDKMPDPSTAVSMGEAPLETSSDDE